MTHRNRRTPCTTPGLAILLAATALAASADTPTLRLREYVGQTWADELIHYPVAAPAGAFPGGAVKLLDAAGQEVPAQLSDVALHADGSLKSAKVWLVVTLQPGEEKVWNLTAGAPQASSDLKAVRAGNLLEVTTARTGARFPLGEQTYDPPLPSAEVPGYLAAIRQRSGAWGGRSWFETPHACRARKVWLMEEGPVFVKVGFEYRFDGYRGAGEDIYQGHVRIAARQELIEFVEDYALGDPAVYQIWKPASRQEEILWDWWGWRPHEPESRFCFSLYDGLKPTRARWFGHSATIPEKRTGRNPGLDFETDYVLDTRADRFDISVNSYHRGCPDQALSYMAWRDEDPQSDAVGVIAIRPTAWQHTDMLPHTMSSLKHHTDTADLRIHAEAKPDLVVRAPLHLGRRVWGLVTLKMPAAGPTRHDPVPERVAALKEKNPKGYEEQSANPHLWRSSEALQLRAKYGNRQLDKVKNWTLAWPTQKTFPALFVKEGGLETVLRRVRASRTLMQGARRHLAIDRYLIEGGAANARGAYDDLMQGCRNHIGILFEHGYCSHKGLNNNQYPWWMQEMAARFDLIMAMPEIPAADKETLKAYFAFCVNLLQDDDFMPPRTTGVGWGSANMPINTRGGRAVTAAALSDNPDAKAWLDRAVEYVDALVPRIWAEDGSPVSGPHYVDTQADPLINMALPLYTAGVLPPIQQKYPRIRAFARHLMDRLTPPERRAGHLRLMPTIGHTRYETDANIGKYAVLMNLTDRRLAGEMYWLWKRAGAATHGFMDGIYYMHEEFQEREPALSSAVYPGSLTFLRHGFPRENETYLALHVGNHSFDHYDRDVGAFLLYAKGSPLMMDFASMYQPNCWQSIWHNTLSWNVAERAPRTPCPGRGHKDCWYTGKTWADHAFEPHHLLDRAADSQSAAADAFKENGGEMKGQAFSREADYVLAAMPLVEFDESVFFNKAESENPVPWGQHQALPTRRLKRPCAWQRRFVFVKDDDLNGPNYFVIHDDLDGQDELSSLANYWCLADAMTVTGDRVHWTGQYEVDLEMYVAFPKKPVITRREWWHNQAGPARAQFKGGREFQIAAHIAQQPGKGGFSVVLYPRGRYELAPSYMSNADGTAVQVRIGDRIDTIFCARTPGARTLDKVRCEGTVAVVKQAPGYTAVTLCEPGSVRTPELEVSAAAPLAIRVAGETLSGTVGAGEVRLRLPKAFAGKSVTVGGKAAGTVGPDGALRIETPGGVIGS